MSFRLMKIRFRTWSVGPALLILLGLAFGLLIPLLGYYWDDWPAILTIRTQDLSAFWDFYRGERPFSAWTFIIFAPLLGTSQLVWHLFTLALRWGTVYAMWWCLHLLWPRRSREVLWMALLFAVYPVFTQQPVAVAFSQHWISYALYFISLAAMILAQRSSRWYGLYTLLGLSTAFLHMMTMEYFTGLELLRPLVLWMLLSESEPIKRLRIKAVLVRWLPYLLTFVGVVIWRLFFMEIIGDDPNRPVLLYAMVSQPLGAFLQLLQFALQDLLIDLFGSWYTALSPLEFSLTDRLYLSALAIGIFSAALAIYYMLHIYTDEEKLPANDPRWHRQAITLGALAFALGALPVWLTERQVLSGLQGARFGLASMFGLSVLVVGLLDWLTPRRLPKIILVGILVGLAVTFHYRTAYAYINSWVKQNQFYWQLAWRAPNLKPGTALLSADELFLYVGRNPTAMSLNLSYPQPRGSPKLAYWFVELAHDIGLEGIPQLVGGKAISMNFRNYSFTGSSLDGLAIYYEPDEGRCLWVLSPEDEANPEIPALTEDVLPVSNLSRIEASPLQDGYPPVELFGKEPTHTWCYYFQKAELARQLGDWQEVVRLADEAQSLGYTPKNPHERLPLIEAFAHAGRWQEALRQTNRAFEKDSKYARRLCLLWEKIDRDLEIPAESGLEITALRNEMQCTALD